jgi:hypothetical protein
MRVPLRQEITLRSISFICLFALLGSCANFPDLDGAISDQARLAKYPMFVRTDLLAVQSRAVASNDTVGATETLAARVAALRHRAGALRHAVMTRADRRRLIAALKRHAN